MLFIQSKTHIHTHTKQNLMSTYNLVKKNFLHHSAVEIRKERKKRDQNENGKKA